MSTHLTVGDVAIIMGDKWAAENGIVRGVTDPMQLAPPEWVAAAKQVIDERRGQSISHTDAAVRRSFGGRDRYSVSTLSSTSN